MDLEVHALSSFTVQSLVVEQAGVYYEVIGQDSARAMVDGDTLRVELLGKRPGGA